MYRTSASFRKDNISVLKGTRGGKGILSGADVREMDHMLQEDGLGISHATRRFSTRPR